MNKYHARRTEFDGYSFDSQAEYRRYCELKLMVSVGEITDLKVHPRYLLQPAFKCNGKVERKIEYEGDFEYLGPDGWIVVEDVKGMKTDVYLIKRKLFLMKYPEIKFVEIN
jgi:hypothetical protein